MFYRDFDTTEITKIDIILLKATRKYSDIYNSYGGHSEWMCDSEWVLKCKYEERKTYVTVTRVSYVATQQ